MRAYYASKLSENISQMPEGYLVCKNVPIARTGMQEYLADELKLEGVPADKLVKVYRSEDEVFSAAALASFEGKPLTDDHPGAFANPDNVCRILKGVCTNVRRGQGEDADKVIADLLVYDPTLIGEILDGKREISCGYNWDREIDEEGRIYQRNIRGNHVAVVSAGRAGSDVAIQDKAPDIPAQDTIKPKIERRSKHMNKPNSKGSILGKLFPMLSKDADPEDVVEVIEQLTEALTPAPAPVDTEPPGAPPAEVPKTAPTADNEVPGWAQALIADIAAIKDQMAKPADADPLAKLEAELAGSEESVTVPAEKLGDDEPQDSDPAADIEPGAEDDDPQGAGSNDTRAQMLAALRAAKPIVAKIKDPAQRQSVSDSFAAIIRAGMGVRPGKTQGGSYTAILDAKQNAAKTHAAKDALPDQNSQRAANLGQTLAEKYNPHYMKK